MYILRDPFRISSCEQHSHGSSYLGSFPSQLFSSCLFVPWCLLSILPAPIFVFLSFIKHRHLSSKPNMDQSEPANHHEAPAHPVVPSSPPRPPHSPPGSSPCTLPSIEDDEHANSVPRSSRPPSLTRSVSTLSDGSGLSAPGPASPLEAEVLEPYPDEMFVGDQAGPTGALLDGLLEDQARIFEDYHVLREAEARPGPVFPELRDALRRVLTAEWGRLVRFVAAWPHLAPLLPVVQDEEIAFYLAVGYRPSTTSPPPPPPPPAFVQVLLVRAARSGAPSPATMANTPTPERAPSPSGVASTDNFEPTNGNGGGGSSSNNNNNSNNNGTRAHPLDSPSPGCSCNTLHPSGSCEQQAGPSNANRTHRGRSPPRRSPDNRQSKLPRRQ